MIFIFKSGFNLKASGFYFILKMQLVLRKSSSGEKLILFVQVWRAGSGGNFSFILFK